MALLVSTVIGLVVWVVLWALTAKGFDSFLITSTILLLGGAGRLLYGYLPGRRRA